MYDQYRINKITLYLERYWNSTSQASSVFPNNNKIRVVHDYNDNNPLTQEEVKEEQLLTEAEDKDVEEVMGVDRKGNKKPDTEISKATKAKQDAKNVKEEVTEEDIQEEVPL